MKHIEAENFVIENARYMEDSPNKPYFVRFPTAHSPKVFFSEDTAELVEQVFKFGKTKEGKELWAKIPKGRYEEVPLIFEDEPEEDEEQKMNKFGMFVYCRRNGMTMDSGLHITIEANTIEEAQVSPRINEELRWLGQFYDEVSYQIHKLDE